MPQLTKTFEFYSPWATRNSRTNQACITMPQMVNGQKPPPVLTIFSEKIEGAGYYKLGPCTHYVTYTVEGAFKGTCSIQVSFSPNPGEVLDETGLGGWKTIESTSVVYTGRETTGSAGVSGGFSGDVSRPTKTNLVTFDGDFAWIRAKLDISRGTLQAIKLNF